MRTLDTGLLAALDSGKFKPYLQLQYCSGDDFIWQDAPYALISYKLGGCELEVNTFGQHPDEWFAIRLKRGVYISGSPVFVTSSHYYVNDASVSQKEHLVVKASILPKGNYQKLYYGTGPVSFKQVIDYVCNLYGYTAAYEDPTAAPWTNYFNYPYDDSFGLNIQTPFGLFSALRQRYLIYAQDNNDGEIYFRTWLDDQDVGTVGHPSLETVTTFDWIEAYKYQVRLLMWLDESKVWHSYPAFISHQTWPVFNIGFVHSSNSNPTCDHSWHANQDKRTWHLKYQDGDIIHCSSGTYQVMPFEVFDKKHFPELYLQFMFLPKFANTQAGNAPEDVLIYGPSVPFDSSGWTGRILDAHLNTAQSVANALEKHDHLSILGVTPGGEILGKSLAMDNAGKTLNIWSGDQWFQISGLVPIAAPSLLLESSSYFLLENGFKLILG